ncbi:heme o synthase, partial [Streptomyces sp. DT225]
MCVTAVESRPAGVALTPSPGGQRPFGARVKAFVALTKPRIIELLLITT